jgi:hypothetical protein
VEVLKRLVDETLSPYLKQKNQRVRDLERHFLAAVAEAEEARISDGRYLQASGAGGPAERAGGGGAPRAAGAGGAGGCAVAAGVEFILRRGSLARRIRRAAGRSPRPERLREVYARLADCLQGGELFDP